MKNFLFVLVFILGVVVIFSGCYSAKANYLASQVELRITDYGAIPNDGFDDSHAFEKIFDIINSKPGKYVISIPSGQFEINKQLTALQLEGEISLSGAKGSIIKINGNGFALLQARSFQVDIDNDIKRGNLSLKYKLNRIRKISDGDLIHIESNSIFETGWKYKEHDIHRIRKNDDGQLFLNSTVFFNYDISHEKVQATVYKNCNLILKNIEFQLSGEGENKKDIPRRTMLTVWGVSLDMENVEFNYLGSEKYFHLGLSILASENLKFKDIRLKGLMYGVLMNFCRNVSGKNTTANFCRHAFTPSQATINVEIENLNGYNCHSVMDAHQAINVHYKNVLDTLATQFPNCRSLGTNIENARIYISQDVYQDYAYWSVQTLIKEYETIYKEYDTRFKKVFYIVPKPSAFNGLTSFTCRNLIVDSCVTSSIAFYGDQKILENVSITNSKVGVIRIDGQKTLVENTLMDGILFPDAKYVFRFTGSGKTSLKSIKVKNYNSSRTYLFDMFYNQPSMNHISIINSSIGRLKGFSNKLVYPGKEYSNVEIISSSFEEFKDKVNPEFPKVSEHIRLQKKQQ